VHRVSPRCRMAAIIAFGLVLAGPGTSSWAPAQSNRASVQGSASNPFGVQPAKPSLVESFSSGVKRGWNGLTNTLTLETPATPAPDPTSLKTRGKPSPRLHVEVARLSEHAGRLDEAEQHYKEALRLDPNDFSAMLNYARLKDRQGQAGAAFELYRRAVDTHPREASVYNYLGLHYDRRGMPAEAAATFAQAVQLKPTEPLYRNNLAHVLVQVGKLSEAYEHLHAVHGEAVAYYNLGYLLHRRGQREAAVQHLTAALRRDPSLTPARQLLAELSPVASPPATVVRPVPRVAAAPPQRTGGVQFPPGAPMQGQSPSAGYRPTEMVPPPEYRQVSPELPVLRPSERNVFPQGPSYVEPPRQETTPLPRRSSVELKQPDGIARDTAELNAPFIRLTGATVINTRTNSD
jgi:Tfp pilus assembly protein PilF